MPGTKVVPKQKKKNLYYEFYKKWLSGELTK